MWHYRADEGVRPYNTVILREGRISSAHLCEVKYTITKEVKICESK